MIQATQVAIVLCAPELLPDFVKKSGKNVLFSEVQDPENSTIEGVRKIRDQIEQIVLSQLNNNI
jgi:multidrug efflux pump subunit AcrB